MLFDDKCLVELIKLYSRIASAPGQQYFCYVLTDSLFGTLFILYQKFHVHELTLYTKYLVNNNYLMINAVALLIFIY